MHLAVAPNAWSRNQPHMPLAALGIQHIDVTVQLVQLEVQSAFLVLVVCVCGYQPLAGEDRLASTPMVQRHWVTEFAVLSKHSQLLC